MLHFLVSHPQLILGFAAGVVAGGFFPPYAIAAAKFVAAQAVALYHKIVH